MRFVLLVEGSTERGSLKAFFKKWLDPKLSQRVGIDIVKFTGYGDFHKKAAKRAQDHLNSPNQSEIIAVIGLLDLSGPNFYPPHATTAKQRYEWGQNHFEKDVDDARFRMFFAVHEFEAWLLSQPNIFPREVKDAFPKNMAPPEKVNFDEHPAKFLEKIYQKVTKHKYKKTTDGINLFSKLDPDIAVSRCPHLKNMLDKMLSMAKAAGL